MKFSASNFAAIGGALVVSIASAIGCQIQWTVPNNYFDSVNDMGELSYWRSLGEIDFGNNFKVPLTIGFNPSRGGNSWLGRGWIIPTLEANVVQVDDRRFLLTQPDGHTRKFWRKSPSASELSGQGNWKGEIDGNSMTLWADCGWKLGFSKGKLVSISTPKNRTLNVIYINGRPSEIQEQGRTMLKVESDPTGTITGLTFGTTRVGVE